MIRSGPFPNRPGIPRTSLLIPVAYSNHESDRTRVIMLKGSAGCLLSRARFVENTRQSRRC